MEEKKENQQKSPLGEIRIRTELSVWERLSGHFETITGHKLQVMKNCFRAGLYRQGIMHDLSKYMPVEFFRGVKYYQGDRSPNDAERKDIGMSLAWLHHKGRNKHHFEYWIDYDFTGAVKGQMSGLEMPLRYVVEMVCDRIAASKTYMKETYTDSAPLAYFERGKDHYLMHPKTKKLLEKLLRVLADHGEEALFGYMRKLLAEEKKNNCCVKKCLKKACCNRKRTCEN